MAYELNEVPEGVRDILAHMPRDMQQRVLADYETHYAPFLNMLAGWKGAVQTHQAKGQDSAVSRLQEEFFPLGEWKFPSQTLAVTQRPPEKTLDVPFGAILQDPALRPWMACGEGWVQATTLRTAQAQRVDNDVSVVLEADYVGATPLEEVLQRGQLAFVAADEAVIGALETAAWWVQRPNQPTVPARFTRYDGYMAFEREIQTARLNQRHLDLWLPPFYPYSRKMICLRMEAEAQRFSGVAPAFDWLPTLRSGFRFVGQITRPSHRAVPALRALTNARSNDPLMRLNAVPVVQTNVDDNVFYPPFPRVGNHYALRMAGAADITAAVAYNDNVAVPASMFRVPSNDPAAALPDVQVQFAQGNASTARIKVYHGSFGQERVDNSDSPSLLQWTPLRFDVPYRVVGGLTVGSEATRAAWAKEAWYHSVLRPPLLTEGDLIEIIERRAGTFANLVKFRYATREIVQDPDEGHTHWRTYLWPSLIAREGHFDSRYGEIPAANYIPLVQSLRLAFERGAASAATPEFLLTDATNYLASALSLYFVLSCFRVEGRLV